MTRQVADDEQMGSHAGQAACALIARQDSCFAQTKWVPGRYPGLRQQVHCDKERGSVPKLDGSKPRKVEPPPAARSGTERTLRQLPRDITDFTGRDSVFD